MKKTSFQLILSIFLGVAVIVAVLIFSGVLPGGMGFTKKSGSTIVLWGTKDSIDLRNFLAAFNQQNASVVKINYIVKDPASYNNDLIEAFATGKGPDLFFVDNESLYKFENKITEIPYGSYPARNFEDNFVQGANIFETDTGVLGLPISVDPLVMYVNKDIYNNAGLSVLPKTWTDFVALTKTLNVIDANNNLSQTTAALGTSNNIPNFKAILSSLFIQAGNPVSIRTGSTYDVALSAQGTTEDNLPPAAAAVAFFMQFVDTSKSAYSWNRSMPEALDNFTAGNAASYFGFASELQDIDQKNPHLNLDAALLPQRDALSNITYGRITALAIAKNSSNVNAALAAAELLTSTQKEGQDLSKMFTVVPASRSQLAAGNADPQQAVFYKAAIGMRTWVDPSADKSTAAFQKMVDSIQSGEAQVYEAYVRMGGELSNLFTNNGQPRINE